MKTKWRKPVADDGGISSLISAAYIQERGNGPTYYCDVTVHAYREVDHVLECALEVAWYYWDRTCKPKKVYYNRVFKNWVY